MWDIACYLSMAILPAVIILRARRIGLAWLASGLLVWALMIIVPLSYLNDPDLDNHLGLACSVLMGWLPAFSYCGLWAILAVSIRANRKNRKDRSRGMDRSETETIA